MSGKENPRSAEGIRIAIDHGLKGDKVAYPDPAAAPLGTDAESAGTPPTREERAIAEERPDVATLTEEVSVPGGGAVLSWKKALLIGVFMLVVGATLVSLRLHQAG